MSKRKVEEPMNQGHLTGMREEESERENLP